MRISQEKINLLDKIIFILIILFVFTLTNSIFLNQIGYFGALLLLIFRISFSKEIVFKKNGLELVFVLFITAELISAILSINKPQAFQNFFKRIILIPIVYVIVAVVNDKKKAKVILYVFLGAALLTIITYIAFAYEHFINQLYRLESKGPSPFQYVMTAGGLISMITIYFFAFFINEKKYNKHKLFYFLAFIITVSALVASYTRAAWLGAISGILILLIIKKQWFILFVFSLILIAVLLLVRNESKILFFKLNSGEVNKITEISTSGRASSVLFDGEKYLVADYNDGILITKENGIIWKKKTPAPVTNIGMWNGYILARLVDSRFLLYKQVDKKELKFVKEFISPGNTMSFRIKNNYLYVMDYDSGLTVFRNSNNLNDSVRYPLINKSKNLAVSDKYLIDYNFENEELEAYELENYLPRKRIHQKKFDSKYISFWIGDSNLILNNSKGLNIYNLKDDFKLITSNSNLLNLISLSFKSDSLITLSASGKLNILEITGNKLVRKKSFDLRIKPASMFFNNKKLCVTFFKRNRLSSVIDIYHETNLQRINQWKVGLKILRDHLVFGVGDIDLQKVYSEYKPYYLKENFGHLHNNYIQILVILGIFGFFIVLYLLIKIFIIDLKIYRTISKNSYAQSFALGTIGVFISFLISGLAEWNFGDQEIITIIWFTLGLNLANYFIDNEGNEQGENV